MGETWSQGRIEEPTGLVELLVRGQPTWTGKLELKAEPEEGLCPDGSSSSDDERKNDPILKVFTVEKRFLCSVSPVFRAMLECACVESSTRRVEFMEGATPADVEAMLNNTAAVLNPATAGFMTAAEAFTEEIVIRLAPIADYYAIASLMAAMCEWVQYNATVPAMQAIEAIQSGEFARSEHASWSDQALDGVIQTIRHDATRSIRASGMLSLCVLRVSTVVAIFQRFATTEPDLVSPGLGGA